VHELIPLSHHDRFEGRGFEVDDLDLARPLQALRGDRVECRRQVVEMRAGTPGRFHVLPVEEAREDPVPGLQEDGV
jgi:hypothetical protein